MDADKWLTLPDDLLVDIFRRLDISAIIQCAGACRPWRHAIINNASCLRPRPGRFVPGLLLGFLEKHLRSRRYLPWQLQYFLASNTSTLPLFLVPETGVCVDGKRYSELLSSRDGFVLLGQDDGTCDSLCLCTALSGVCRVLPAAEFDDNSSRRCMYVLATGYDVVDDDSTSSDDGHEIAVWILAVNCQADAKDGITYQIFSSTSGEWGLVKRSAKFPEDVAFVRSCQRSPVVCHGAVSWLVLVSLVPDDRDALSTRIRLCIFSMDLRTERTWTTELPDLGTVDNSFVLAVSEDGRLSLFKMLTSSHKMDVWVLVGDGGQWMPRRTIDDVQKLLPNCPSMGHMWLSGFCPRSGYLFGTGRDDHRNDLLHHFVIGVDGSSPRLLGSVDSRNSTSRFPYEMDLSTYMSSYVSKMKYF